jgi:hypothetical protein
MHGLKRTDNFRKLRGVHTDCTAENSAKYKCMTRYDRVSGSGAPQGSALAGDLSHRRPQQANVFKATLMHV